LTSITFADLTNSAVPCFFFFWKEQLLKALIILQNYVPRLGQPLFIAGSMLHELFVSL
jgi:hypothetical protein